MYTANFQKLIGLITSRDFIIRTNDVELKPETEYFIYRILPVSKRTVSFYWKTPKTEDKMLRSFITAFTSKYREPDPRCYTTCSPYFAPSWNEMTAEKQEFAYCHHASNMFSKESLLKQVEANFAKDGVSTGLIRYGFYNTEYGIGIFCFWMTEGVNTAINVMKDHLQKLSIPFTNEFSEARWVFRFKIGLTKETHLALIDSINQAPAPAETSTSEAKKVFTQPVQFSQVSLF